MPASQILLVEDDQALQTALVYNLNKEGYRVLVESNGAKALETARAEKPDLVLLDIMLPGMSGLEVCRVLRSESRVPVIILTARTEELDKVTGLDLGADDYITKPFGMRELLARIRARLRSQVTAVETLRLHFGDVIIDLGRHAVTKNNQPLELTRKEYDLLAFLAQNQGLVFSREQLCERVWGYDFAGGTRTIDVHMRWLRAKIEPDPETPRYLITVRGTGYKLEA
jgi:two-component system OmpR family response regulator